MTTFFEPAASTLSETFWSRPLSVVFEATVRRFVPWWVLTSVGRLFARRAAPTTHVAIGGLCVFLGLAAVLVAVTLLEGQPIAPVVLAIFGASLTCSLALVLLAHLAHEALRTLRCYFDPLSLDWRTKRTVLSSFVAVTPARQIGFALFCAMVGWLVTWSMDPNPMFVRPALLQLDAPIPVYGSTYLAMVAAGFTLGFGVLYAVLVPAALARALALEVGTLPFSRLNPSKTAFVQQGIRVVNQSASAAAAIVALCLVTLTSLRPVWLSGSMTPFLAALVFGALVTTAAFALPQIVVARLIAREKAAVVAELQAKADALWADAMMDRAKLDQLMGIQQMLHVVERSPNTALRFDAFRTYAAWIFSQAAATVVGVYPWGERLG